MPSFLKIPKNQIIAALLLLLIATSSKLGISLALLLFVLCVGFTIGADVFFTYLRRRVVFLPYSAIITGLILTLIIDPSAMWYQIAIIAAAAMAIKNFIRPLGRHIFNPAASGLLIGWVVFGLQPSWWAASAYNPTSFFALTNLPVLIPILLIGCISLYRYRRYASAVLYVVVYCLLLFLTNLSVSLTSAALTILSIGTLFYTFLMLVEPMTSPVNKRRQVLYGAVVAAGTVALVHLQKIWGIAIFDVSLTALLLGNLLFFKFR